MNASAFTTASEFLALFYYYGSKDMDRKTIDANKNGFNQSLYDRHGSLFDSSGSFK